MKNWYLVYSKARQEQIAARGLAEQGYEVYLPMLRARKRRARGMVDVEEPLFARYLFVSPKSAEHSISSVQFTGGVQKLIKFGAELVPIDNKIISILREREDPETGFHSLPAPQIARGERVRVATGVLEGLDAIFEARTGHDRAIVLLELLGQQTRTEVLLDELES